MRKRDFMHSQTGKHRPDNPCLAGARHTHLSLVLLILALTLAAPVLAHDDDALDEVRFDQNLDAQIPLDLTFEDEAGSQVQLGDYLGEQPVILVLGYYECETLCSVVFPALAQTLNDVDGFELGREYEVVSVSIDSGETPDVAKTRKAGIAKLYSRSGFDKGWHFLTGDETAIHTLAETVGFHYTYDDETDQYAHPTGIMILTLGGKIARYLYGVDYTARSVRLGLVEASDNEIGSPVDQLLLLCYRYDPVTGRYNVLVGNVLRAAGLLTVVSLGSMIAILLRRERTGGGNG